jgi:hypothetical protein
MVAFPGGLSLGITQWSVGGELHSRQDTLCDEVATILEEKEQYHNSTTSAGCSLQEMEWNRL